MANFQSTNVSRKVRGWVAAVVAGITAAIAVINPIWGGFAGLALVSLWILGRTRRTNKTLWPTWTLVVGVALMVLALFVAVILFSSGSTENRIINSYEFTP